MKLNYHNLLGKQVNLNVTDAATHLLTSFCEAIMSSCSDTGLVEKNLFKRSLAFSTSGDLSFSTGFASTGLRTGSIFKPDEIADNLERISNSVRLHIPLVIFASVKSQFQINQLAQTGAVVFSAGNAQEALDLLLISYQIAELSLISVVVCFDEESGQKEENIFFPEKEIIMHFAGNTDALIPSPTASQQIIFGKNRKRIPGWFNPDNPVSIGNSKQTHETALETAAQQEFFYSHLDQIIADSFDQFNKEIKDHPTASSKKPEERYVNGVSISPVSLFPYSRTDADYLLLSYGRISNEIVQAIDSYYSKNKVKINAARLVQISPFPEKSIKPILIGKKGITLLEQPLTGFNNSNILKELICQSANGQKIHYGNYGTLPNEAQWLDVIANMMHGGMGKLKFRVGIDFTHTNSKYPKHEVLLRAIEREYPAAQKKTLSSGQNSAFDRATNLQNIPLKENKKDVSIPLNIRKYKDQGPAYSKLSRFYDDTVSFFMTELEELVADPFQAIPVMPPSTAGFNYNTNLVEQSLLPVFNSNNCTGCGDCFLHCPHSAINPIVIGIENIIKAGITISKTNGVMITQLTPLVKNLAKEVHLEIKEKYQNSISTSGSWKFTDYISAAFEKIVLQTKLEGDKLNTAKQDLEAFIVAIKDLPVSVTEQFYSNSDKIKKGSGELFSLAINTNSCTGCSVCASVCNDDALTMADHHSEIISDHDTKFALWENLPDTNSDTINSLLEDKIYNPFSAILLSRNFNLSLNGRSEYKNGDSFKSMVHLLTALAEFSIKPKMNEAINSIDELIDGLEANINSQLGSALPTHDINALSKVLFEIKEDKKPYEELVEKLGSGEHLKLIDTKSLKRKVELVKSLRTLKWLLSEGATGTGRARMGFAFDGNSEWRSSYPWNNFTSPVMIQLGGTTPELAKGMIQGQIRQMLDNIKILRRSQLEIDGNYEPEINDAQIASLNWSDLTEKEKDIIPPIIILGSRAKLAGRDMDSLLNMLDGGWPLKALVLDDSAPVTDHVCSEITGGIGSLLSVLASGNTFVLKSSLAVPHHLFEGLSEVFTNNKPALAWVYTPSISKHLLPSETFPKLNALSLNSRAFPVFKFNPQHEGNLLSSKIGINENPQNDSDWLQSDLKFNENGEEQTLPYSLTWADWAYTLKSWREKFMLHSDEMGLPVQVSEFITLSKSERIGKSPVIYRINHNEELVKYKVSEEVIKTTEASLKAWLVLKEISGELTEFPEKLYTKVEEELSEKYEKLMSESKQEYENKISGLEKEHLEKIRIKLKEKLMMLSRKTLRNTN